MIAGDRAGKSHWESTWAHAAVPKATGSHGSGPRGQANRELAAFLERWLGKQLEPRRLIELGCARSIWLPYFAKDLGYTVTGLDYSERGCELARATLDEAGAQGQVVLGDFFDPPVELQSHFEAAFSFGVAEHFEDTSGCIAAFARFLKPDGRLVTLVPNMTGVPGFLQKQLNRAVYDKHVPLDREHLTEAHRTAGLKVVTSGYLLSTNFGVLNLTGLRSHTPSWLAKRLFLAALNRLSLVGWAVEPYLPKVQALAGYVYCVADRIGSHGSAFPH
jgi:SAM-dependent methyltransferase